MRVIYLGKDSKYECYVSDEDYDWLIQWKWNFVISRGGHLYARRHASKNGQDYTLLMHVAICERHHGPKPGPYYTPDHLDRNTLNNQNNNLAWKTKKEQIQNRHRKVCKVIKPVDVNEEPIPF